MRFVSTRGSSVDAVSFTAAVLEGSYARDGGMLMPEKIPQLTSDVLESWRKLRYRDLCKEVLRLFVDENELSTTDLDEIFETAFESFDDPVEVVHLEELLNTGVFVAELWHGPTRAFKDVALQPVARVFEKLLEKTGKKAVVLVSTSGDTGGATIESLKASKRCHTICLFPLGRVTEIQRLQMTVPARSSQRIHVYGVEGTSDDADVPVKELVMDPLLVAKHGLTIFNSVNVARILLQIPMFVYAYLKVSPPGESAVVEVVVPTGGAGCLTAGVLAFSMGVPISLVPCTNSNDVAFQVFKSGRFFPKKDVARTHSSAMDILVPYNLERIFFLLSGLDGAVVRTVMQRFEGGDSVALPDQIVRPMKDVVPDAFCCSEETTIETMRSSKDIRKIENEIRDILRQVTASVTFLPCLDTQSSKDIRKIENEIRDILRQVTASVTFLPCLDTRCSFEILVFTKANDEGLLPPNWGDTDEKKIQNPQSVTFKNFTTGIHKVDSCVTYKMDD
ncbi:unnamed protein product [Cyprideis torosa]|uniref:Uncharacterized protein n=1 Tax=Cyprideis torosa TaxID=163714 RepID=A0A7R8WGL1_9CRUS|nr:unnamed protein product [Cyprideis torosa]CAG0898287.1 unnamed protein product [Cyprideis torosa]